ncbi:MAG TPA: hypothetical protein PLD02_01255 [Saprospiraceae bacterium]|nr:hypothetical protein [Saprospiraceae bacterium]
MNKPIKILYAPYNIASMPAITIDELNASQDIIARGVCIDYNQYISFGIDPKKNWKVFKVDSNIRKPFLYLINLICAEFYLIKYIIWADAIIWQWDIKVYMPHYWLIKILKKPILVEWLGSDIRVPEFVIKHNPYYKKALGSGTYTYTRESLNRSNQIQKKFKKLNATPILCPEMSLYLNPNIFETFEPIFQRIDINKFNIRYPDANKSIPIICHTPSATGAKGTIEVRKIMDRLKLNYSFEYVEITNKSHAEAIQAIEQCDIYLDQFILGAYGMAACEAMSMGKPVFCYLMDPVINSLPKDCPIVNANLNILESLLLQYIEDGKLRYNSGIKSRLYVKNYHEVSNQTKRILAIIMNLTN